MENNKKNDGNGLVHCVSSSSITERSWEVFLGVGLNYVKKIWNVNLPIIIRLTPSSLSYLASLVFREIVISKVKMKYIHYSILYYLYDFKWWKAGLKEKKVE